MSRTRNSYRDLIDTEQNPQTETGTNGCDARSAKLAGRKLMQDWIGEVVVVGRANTWPLLNAAVCRIST